MVKSDTLSTLIFHRRILNPNATADYIYQHIGHMFTLEEITQEMERE